jgi:hypothetical protein
MRRECLPVLIFFFVTGALHGQQTPPGAAVDRDLLAANEDGAPVRNADENFAEARAYSYLLVHSRKFPAAELKLNARKDIAFAHLFEEPAKYRGSLVYLEGRLRRLRRFDPPALAAKEGVPALYEGWLFTAGSFSNPFCVVVSEIGPGISLGERSDDEVAFTGYFFKKYRYKAGDGWRDAPLLIGRSLVLIDPDSATSSAPTGSVYLYVIVGTIATTVALAVGLIWWFRLSDRQVRAKLQSIRDNARLDRL